MASKERITRPRFFSAAKRPTYKATGSSGPAPHCWRRAWLRCAGLKRSVSTPREITVSRSNPQEDSSSASAWVGTVVQDARL